jgi:hypothetical protein
VNSESLPVRCRLDGKWEINMPPNGMAVPICGEEPLTSSPSTSTIVRSTSTSPSDGGRLQTGSAESAAMSAGAVAGLVVGVLCCVLLLLLLLLVLLWRRRRQQEQYPRASGQITPARSSRIALDSLMVGPGTPSTGSHTFQTDFYAVAPAVGDTQGLYRQAPSLQQSGGALGNVMDPFAPAPPYSSFSMPVSTVSSSVPVYANSPSASADPMFSADVMQYQKTAAWVPSGSGSPRPTQQHQETPQYLHTASMAKSGATTPAVPAHRPTAQKSSGGSASANSPVRNSTGSPMPTYANYPQFS